MLIQGNMARIVRCRGYNEMGVEEILKKKNYPIPQLFNLRTMAETHQPIWIPNVKLDPRWLDYPESNWIQSFVGAPIVTQSGVVGFINLDSNTPDFYKPEDGERLLAFANQAAVAVETPSCSKNFARTMSNWICSTQSPHPCCWRATCPPPLNKWQTSLRSFTRRMTGW